MAKYVILVRWTDQGAQSSKESVSRGQKVIEMGATHGVTIDTLLWTMGQYDIVVVADAPDNATAAAFSAIVSGMGTVRTETYPAFTAEEAGSILG